MRSARYSPSFLPIHFQVSVDLFENIYIQMRNNTHALHTVVSMLVTLILPHVCAISPQGYTLHEAVICVNQSLTHDARCVMLCSRRVFS